MTLPAAASRLQIYVNARDRFEGKPVFHAIVLKARADGMAGASVFPAAAGYGIHRRIHDEMSDYEFADVSVIVELIDAPDRIDAFVADLGGMIGEGMATVTPVRVLRYSDQEHPSGG
jgi:PII-like signaling protein